MKIKLKLPWSIHTMLCLKNHGRKNIAEYLIQHNSSVEQSKKLIWTRSNYGMDCSFLKGSQAKIATSLDNAYVTNVLLAQKTFSDVIYKVEFVSHHVIIAFLFEHKSYVDRLVFFKLDVMCWIYGRRCFKSEAK